MNLSGGGDGNNAESDNGGYQNEELIDYKTLSKISTELDVPPEVLIISTIQNLMLQTKQYNSKAQANPKHDGIKISNPNTWNEIAEKLWGHLMAGRIAFDDQLLCATCFYTVLNIADISMMKLYIEKVHEVIISELNREENDCNVTYAETATAVALMYGMFQSNFLKYKKDEAQTFEKELDLETVLKTIVKLLISMAYEYTKFTYIVFKTMSSFEKVRRMPAEDLIFDRENCYELLNMINHNWENHITGVRDLNRKVLYTCLSVFTSQEDMKLGRYFTKYSSKLPYSEYMYTFFTDVSEFGWNKAKYLMATEMIKSSFAPPSFNDGITSLKKPGVVAAGADLYYVILERTVTIEDWCSQYLKGIVEILKGSSEKAIENFTDYWCLPTLKKFPSVLDILVFNLGAIDTDYKLLSFLSLLKQGNKLGIEFLNWSHTKVKDFEKDILGLNHCNPKIRMLAFETIFMTFNKEMALKKQYDLMIDFLNTNINSDCRVLRINMLKSLANFLVHLHEIYRGKLKTKHQYNEEELVDFCVKYQELVVSSLKMNGNYQRKVTCIELIDSFLNNLSHVQRKRKKQTKVESSVIQALETNGLLLFMTEEFIESLMKLTSDPADDIRDNTNNVLLKYYVEYLKNPEVFNNLINEAQKCMSSKFFFDISCGHSKFNLIINLLIKNNVHKGIFKNVEDIFDFAFQNMMSEYKLGRGIVESIEQGKQLHSYITLLTAVFQRCQENHYKIQITRNQYLEILDVLKGISSQFVWEQTDSTSSDFAKMNEMVEDVINKSEYASNETDETKLSGMHQIVLNCLWLNVKASCELSSTVIQSQTHEDERDICESALNSITRVLETCRHKGAIEAAGVALGKSIRHLTSLNTPLSSLPLEWLQKKMRELISQTSAMASVTRRGAGLSIMLHRAVSSDARKEKPLFQYFMNTILEVCRKADIPIPLKTDYEASSKQTLNKTNLQQVLHSENFEKQSLNVSTESELLKNMEKVSVQENTEMETIKEDTEKDIPMAIYIHFLTRIVTDSSLTCDVMFYSAKIAELAFGNLTSPHWQIRNAALQLYGALLPKLIGQKKSACDDHPFATVGCDELRTHHPTLWSYMMQRLDNIRYDDIIQHHSTLIPILNVLANCAKRYDLSIDLEIEHYNDEVLLLNLIRLLASPIYTVRKLTAKAIYNVAPEVKLQKIVFNVPRNLNENALNGRLMLLEHYMKCDVRKPVNGRFLYEIYKEAIYEDPYEKSRKTRSICYVNKLQFLDAIPISQSIEKTWEDLTVHIYAPGVEAWAKKMFEIRLSTQSWKEVLPFISTVLGYVNMYLQTALETPKQLNPKDDEGFDPEDYVAIVLQMVETADHIPPAVLEIMCEKLLENTKNAGYATWKLLYEISKKLEPQDFEYIKGLSKAFDKDTNVCYKTRFVVPFAARIAWMLEDRTALTRIAYIIMSWTDSETTDCDLRYIAALSINEIANYFKDIADELKLIIIKSAILLLQDEDENVRNTSTEFFIVLSRGSIKLQPYVCLINLLDFDFLCTFLDKEMIRRLCGELMELMTKLRSRKKADDYNPFTNDAFNIYLETDVLKKLFVGLCDQCI